MENSVKYPNFGVHCSKKQARNLPQGALGGGAPKNTKTEKRKKRKQ